MARGGDRGRGGEDQEGGGLARGGRKSQPAGPGQVGMACIGIGDDDGERPRSQRFFRRPEDIQGPLKRDGDEAGAGKAQGLQPKAIKTAIFARLAAKAAPQQRAPVAAIGGESAQAQGKRPSHGGGRIAIGGGSYVMQR